VQTDVVGAKEMQVDSEVEKPRIGCEAQSCEPTVTGIAWGEFEIFLPPKSKVAATKPTMPAHNIIDYMYLTYLTT
jgi:hypothetical protein